MFTDMGGVGLFFGDKRSAIIPSKVKEYHLTTTGLFQNILAGCLPTGAGCKSVLFVRQVHGTSGVVTEDVPSLRPWQMQGDYIVTCTKGLGVGILTADCLPVLIADEGGTVCCAVHAGWRGAVAGVLPEALKLVCRVGDVPLEKLRFYFGPSAKSCCYEVGEDFRRAAQRDLVVEASLEWRDGHCFFDLPGYNRRLLGNLGVVDKAISTRTNACTICNAGFSSVRREPGTPFRQISAIWLK